MAVLSSDGNALAIQQRLNLFRVACGMDAAVDHLVFLQITKLTGVNFLDLCQEIAGIPQFLCGITDLCAGSGVFFVGEAGTLAGIFFHQNGVTGSNNRSYLNGCTDNSVFTLFDIFQYTENHGCILSYAFSATSSISTRFIVLPRRLLPLTS